MKIRTRLMLTFLALIIVPVIFMSIVLMALGVIQTRSLRSTYDINGSLDIYSATSVRMYYSMTLEVQEELEDIASEDPDMLEDEEYLNDLNNELSSRSSYLLVLKDSALIYNGTSEEDAQTILEELVEYYEEQGESGSVFIKDTMHLITDISFQFSDASEGSVLIVTYVGGMIPQVRSIFFTLLIIMLAILLLIALSILVWINNSILNPLAELQKATQEIKQGNLEYAVDVNVSDKNEIGQLCMDFEEMRQRLKDSAEERLEDDRESKEMLRNISHDLKTPITTIKGYSEGIMDGVASSPEMIDRYIRTIYNKANDMDKLIDELTFYTKIDTNRVPYVFTKINLNEYFEDCIESLGTELAAENIDLGFFDYTEEPVTVIADAEQLKRVINNIISNSVKYMDKSKGIINIRLKDEGDFVLIEMEDNGKGIAARDLPNIFDRFFRTDSSRNSSKGGSGIGLSIVKKIIEDHGGRIWATSKESIGTVMHISLRKYREEIHE